ncbi:MULTISPECIES: hypothetical protein [Bosea]|nr:hypothetical protein [Bosea vaviloviae]
MVAAILWLWGFKGHRSDRWDVVGAAVCLVGSAIFMFAPRRA